MMHGGRKGPSAAPLKLSCAVLLFGGLINYGHSWNLPNVNYPGVFDGTFGGNRGYSQASAAGASWNPGHPGAVDQTVNSDFGVNQWSGDGRPLNATGAGFNGAVGGGAGRAGNDNGAAFGGEQGFGYHVQFPARALQGTNNEGYAPAGSSKGGASAPARSLGGPGLDSAGAFGGPGSGPAGIFDRTGSTAGSSVGDVGSSPARHLVEGGTIGTGPGSSVDGAGQARPVDAGVTSSSAGSIGRPVTGEANKAGAPTHNPIWSNRAVGLRPVDIAGEPGGSFGGAPGSFVSSGKGTGLGKGVLTVPLAVVGVRPVVPYYGNRHALPVSYPRGFGGYGAGGHPWYGTGGYVYRTPVAHINPDGSYGFTFQKPPKKTGDRDGNFDGNNTFNNDGAAPDVDLRSSIAQIANELNPTDYGPQSVHSRARLPLVPPPAVDGVGAPYVGFPTQTLQGDAGPASGRNGPGGKNEKRTESIITSLNSPADSALRVIGLPTSSSVPSGITSPGTSENPNVGNQHGVVRNAGAVGLSENSNDRTTLPAVDEDGPSTEDSTDSINNLSGSFPHSDGGGILNNRAGEFLGALTTSRSPQALGEPVITRPESDLSYNFAYQIPTATREESADREGTVRGSLAYNNEARRNDLQNLVGAGTDIRPFGGSSTVPNGLRNVAASSGVGSVGTQLDGSYRFGNQAPDSTRQESANGVPFDNPTGPNDLQYVAGAGIGFRPIGLNLSVPNGLRSLGGLGGGSHGGSTGAIATPPVGGFGRAGSDGSYQFGYRTPDSEREESADSAGNVRGSYAYNNEAGTNDLQYVAGAGTAFHPTSGSLSVPNGLGLGSAGAGGARGSDGTFNNRSGLGRQSFLPAGSSGSNGIRDNGNGISTHNTTTRRPQDVLLQRRWNTGNGASATTAAPFNFLTSSTSRDVANEKPINNLDDTQQTTTFGNFDVGKQANLGKVRI